MTRREVYASSADELKRDYPIADRVPDWFFRVVETSASAWQAEGCDLWGRKVSRAGGDPDALLEACVSDARAIAAEIHRPICTACDDYDEEIEIHGPEQLRRIVTKIKTAVEQQQLRSVNGQAKPVDLPAFSDLDLGDTLPDFIDYRFDCAACGRAFELQCECYHGAGGQWRPI